MDNALEALHAVGPNEAKQLNTQQLRKNFLLDTLYTPGSINLVYTHYDRMITGVASPTGNPLMLANFSSLKSNYFLERRELGIINVGGNGTVTTNGTTHQLSKYDCVYVGKGTKEVSFTSNSATEPAVFFLLSSPAHKEYPTTFMQSADATPTHIGSQATSNERTVYKYIYMDGIQSCQLVMGLTRLAEGSVWNTMPSHVHDRRCEIYFYFDVPADQGVFHFMGEPQETRHMVLRNYQAIASPAWSIHSGCGTSNYSFIWGMAGENKEYTDMDACPVSVLL